MDYEETNLSEEMVDVADPSDVEIESEEMVDVADPSSEGSAVENGNSKTASDSAFAEQRRRIAELERQLKISNDALGLFFDGDNSEELSINARAYADNRDPEDVRAEYQQADELERLRLDNEELKGRLIDQEVDKLMREALEEIKSIDPSVLSLDELGDSFAKFISAGLSNKEAYYATKAHDASEKTFAPSSIGKVADTKAERDYFTSEELDKLTPSQLDDPKIWEKVQRSMNKL